MMFQSSAKFWKLPVAIYSTKSGFDFKQGSCNPSVFVAGVPPVSNIAGIVIYQRHQELNAAGGLKICAELLENTKAMKG